MPVPTRSQIHPGLQVRIVEKQNQPTGKETEGVVAKILTKSPTHPHGIKVMLEDGRVGRVQGVVWTGNRRACKMKGQRRLPDVLVVVGIVAALIGAILIVTADSQEMWQGGWAVVIAGIASFVAACCLTAAARGRSWAFGLLAIVPIVAIPLPQIRSTNEAHTAGQAAGTVLLRFALGYVIVYLVSRPVKKL